MLLFMFFIILLNVIAIALTYYCLDGLEKKDRVLFIAIGIAIMYMLTSFVYWLSTKGVEIKEVAEQCKNLITFLFVPINGLIVLPILAKSYRKYKIGRLKADKLRNRGILLAILLLGVLIVECSYFKDIQIGVIQMLNQNIQKQDSQESQTNQIENEVMNNQVYQNGINATIVNQVEDTKVNENYQNVSAGRNETGNIVNTN